ncbi:MAG TPA: hypothetical protein VFQ61_00130, partial [Polyangiaceae bacterium]|nr:hypothetical protein [Polyangiaceae bacterium]
MAQSRDRRRIDWRIIMDGKLPAARLSNPTLPVKQLAALIAEAMSDPTPETPDRIIRHTVDFSKETLQLERSAVYLLDEENFLMTGTWGSDAQGSTIDEHALIYDYGPIDREVFARAQAGFPWTAYDDCPHIAQVGEETQVIGQGWVACTAIVGPTGPLGIFFNDTAISHNPLDESRQWRAAILCSILANALWRLKTADVSTTAHRETPQPEIVRRVARLLTQDPTLSCDALARQLNLSPRGLARSFK